MVVRSATEAVSVDIASQMLGIERRSSVFNHPAQILMADLFLLQAAGGSRGATDFSRFSPAVP